MKLTNRELAKLIKANPGRWPKLEDATQRDDEPEVHDQPGRNPVEHAAAIGIVALTRALSLAYWSGAVLATLIMYDNYGGMGGAGIALLCLSLAGMVVPASHPISRIFSNLSQAFWMLFAVITAGAALYDLSGGRRRSHSRRGGPGYGIFSHTARFLVAMFVLVMLFALGKAHAWEDCKSGLCAENSIERAAKHTCSATCRKDNGGPCQRCLEDHTACVVTIIKKVPLMTGNPDEDLSPYGEAMSTVGEHYPVTGAATLKWLCQHGGLCISTDAVRFDQPCVYKAGEGWEKARASRHRQ
jgi:hypothetical protein